PDGRRTRQPKTCRQSSQAPPTFRGLRWGVTDSSRSSGPSEGEARERVPVVAETMLLDAPSLYFRAFYGVPDTFRAPDGSPVNAVRGLLDFISYLVRLRRPDRLVACLDAD